MDKKRRKNHRADDENDEIKRPGQEQEVTAPPGQWQEAANASPDDFEDGVGEPGASYEPGARPGR